MIPNQIETFPLSVRLCVSKVQDLNIYYLCSTLITPNILYQREGMDCKRFSILRATLFVGVFYRVGGGGRQSKPKNHNTFRKKQQHEITQLFKKKTTSSPLFLKMDGFMKCSYHWSAMS